MSTGLPPPRAKFVPAVEPGSPMARFLLKRAAWRQAVDDWLADSRPDFLVVEPIEPLAPGEAAA